MLKKIKKDLRFGQATIEFLVIVTIIIAAFLIFQKYIVQAMQGRWKVVGESFSQGRQYSPDHTTECKFDPVYTGNWYDFNCFVDSDCATKCYTIKAKFQPGQCQPCIESCYNPLCDE